jgi:hypothetical protein
MGVIDCLPRALSAVYSDIETCYHPISFQNIGPKLIEHDADGAAFGFK